MSFIKDSSKNSGAKKQITKPIQNTGKISAGEKEIRVTWIVKKKYDNMFDSLAYWRRELKKDGVNQYLSKAFKGIRYRPVPKKKQL